MDELDKLRIHMDAAELLVLINDKRYEMAEANYRLAGKNKYKADKKYEEAADTYKRACHAEALREQADLLERGVDIE
jgi:hypothetical protein